MSPGPYEFSKYVYYSLVVPSPSPSPITTSFYRHRHLDTIPIPSPSLSPSPSPSPSPCPSPLPSLLQVPVVREVVSGVLDVLPHSVKCRIVEMIPGIGAEAHMISTYFHRTTIRNALHLTRHELEVIQDLDEHEQQLLRKCSAEDSLFLFTTRDQYVPPSVGGCFAITITIPIPIVNSIAIPTPIIIFLSNATTTMLPRYMISCLALFPKQSLTYTMILSTVLSSKVKVLDEWLIRFWKVLQISSWMNPHQTLNQNHRHNIKHPAKSRSLDGDVDCASWRSR